MNGGAVWPVIAPIYWQESTLSLSRLLHLGFVVGTFFKIRCMAVAASLRRVENFYLFVDDSKH